MILMRISTWLFSFSQHMRLPVSGKQVPSAIMHTERKFISLKPAVNSTSETSSLYIKFISSKEGTWEFSAYGSSPGITIFMSVYVAQLASVACKCEKYLSHSSV